MKEKKPPCFGDLGKVEASKCKGCKFVLSCYAEWGRKKKMRRAEEHRSAPKNMKLSLRERKPFARASRAKALMKTAGQKALIPKEGDWPTPYK